MARRPNSKRFIQQLAREQLGYDSLRPGQEAAMQSILKGQDTLAVMPTGSGKSAIYQLAAAQIPGATVVISPLLALQQDQVESIADQGLGEAAAINSKLSMGDREEVFETLEQGELEFLFLAPEQFNNPETLERLQHIKPSLFVVDEAHCISEWGHNFRPDYLRLGNVIHALGHPTVLALTATASPPVRQEIIERLGMRSPHVVVKGFDRPNIWLGVERVDDEEEKQGLLLKRVQQLEKPGIIYVATRKKTEELADLLEQRGIAAIPYHAGLNPKSREQIQSAFMSDEVEVIVATIAFGMGVDKPNVRFVLHYNMSDSVDAYYQEIGRAGRDNDLARAILFYTPNDINLRRYLGATGKLESEQVQQVVEVVQQQHEPVNVSELKEQTDLSKTKIKTTLSHLEAIGVVQTLATGEVFSAEEPTDVDNVITSVLEAQGRREQVERSRLEMMRGYAEVRNCRREYLLNYFGEQLEGTCGFCDNCESGSATESQGMQPFPVHSRVIHKSWGEGAVMRYEDDKIVVLFDQVGYKTLSIAAILLERLLRQI